MKDSLYLSLFDKFKHYIKRSEDQAMLERAYLLARDKHQGQMRRSGEPYITHPVAVASILASLDAGPQTLAAALMHDLVEDTEVTLNDITKDFGKEVAQLVNGVTKLTKLQFDVSPSQADNHQKMLLAMAKDIRVILIKIADRLHNMRTLSSMSPDSQVRIAKETLEIYAPIAHKLGLFVLKAELEDRALRYTDPEKYHKISGLIQSKREEREQSINNIISNIDHLFTDNDLVQFEIKGRIKNIYSIFKKIYINQRSFEDIYDLLAIRIIVDKVENCYQALGLIHANFTPIPRRFKDYIAVPKPNMYQSLHTTVLAQDGTLFEVQIRTKEMDDIAELGVAAHWAYKENKVYSKEREQFEIAQKLKWYGELLKMSEDVDEDDLGSKEFVDSVKGDILEANVYVFTPKGEVIELPKGGTPIDFAYRIHTDVGHKMTGAIVNNKIVPIDTQLKTGDIINVKTNKNSFGPSESWLKLAKSSHARTKIKAFLNKRNFDQLMQQGKEHLERELSNQKINEVPTDEFVKKHFAKQSITTLSALTVEIGKGNISPKTVVAKLSGTEVAKDVILQKQMDKTAKTLETHSETGIVVPGLANPLVKLANCCLPIPGDEINGYIARQGGIVVHMKDCPNLKTLEEERMIEVFWSENIKRTYPILIKIIGSDSTNFLYEVVSAVNASSVSVAEMSSQTNTNLETIIKLKVTVEDRKQLQKLIINVKNITDVYSVERDFR